MGVPSFVQGPISPTSTTLPATSSINSPIELASGETWKKWNGFARINTFNIVNIGNNFKNISVDATEIYAKSPIAFPAKHRDIVTNCATYALDSANCVYRVSLICGKLNETTQIFVIDPGTPADISAGAKCCEPT